MFEGGDLLAGRYRLLDKIGEGGAAEVFRARDQRLDRIVAVKLLRPQFTSDPQSRTRFENEAKAAAALSHPNIVDVYDVGDVPGGLMFIAMQFVDGENLKDILQQRGRLSPAETISIAQQVCHALAAAHARGIIHRDVKPQNIMIDHVGNVRLTDFGVAKALAAPALTQSGMTFGTAAYLSPEQATGQPISPQSDLYALGCVMYEMLSGSPPFTGDNPAIVAYKQVWEQPRPLHDTAPEVPPSLENVVMRLLNKDPEKRPPSADALSLELERLKAPSFQPTQAVLVETVASAPSPEATPRPAAAERSQAIPMPLTPSNTEGTAHAVPPVRAQIAGTQATAYSPNVYPAPVATPAAAYTPRPPQPAAVVNVPDRRGLGWVPFALVAILLLGICGLGAFKGRDLFGAGFPIGVGTGVVSTPTQTVVAQAVVTATATRPLGQVVEGSPVVNPPTPVPPTDTPVPPTSTPAPPTDTPVPPIPVPATDTPAPPAQATDTPVVEVPTDTPVPNPPPTDTPVAAPPATDTPVPAPPPSATHITLDDTTFTGGATRSNGLYHGRTAHWIYGQGTPYHTMSTTFNVVNPPSSPSTLLIVGVDSEDPDKTPIQISVNGTVIYQGPDPLPNDTRNGPNGSGNWGSYSWLIDSGVLVDGANTLSISNLSPSDKINYPLFFMLDYAIIYVGQ